MDYIPGEVAHFSVLHANHAVSTAGDSRIGLGGSGSTHSSNG